ncbi:MAG: hypothetical protein AB1898_08645 [Acidobacteriota bacterium]
MRLFRASNNLRTVGSLVAIACFLLSGFSLAGQPERAILLAAFVPSSQPTTTRNREKSPSVREVHSVESTLQRALDVYRAQLERIKSESGPKGANGTGRRNREYHGNVFEYVRNDILDALPHQVRQAQGDKSVLRRNQFGFNLTGPVKIPRLFRGNGQTFFSLTYEGTRERIARPFLSTAPTLRQRSGDFSDLVDNAGEPITIYDPLTTRPNPNYDPSRPVSVSNLQYLRDPFPGNVIPAERIDPVARRVAEFYPPPNANVGPFLRNNFFRNNAETNTPNGIVFRLDHSIGTRHKLTWNGRLSTGVDGAAPIFENPANPGAPARRARSRSMSISETFNVSPTITNQFSASASYSGLANEEADEATNYAELIGLQGVQAGAFPRFHFEDSEYVNIGNPPGAQIRFQNAYYSVSEQLAVRLGSHNLKIGFSGSWGQVNSFRPRYPSGKFDFNGKLTSLPGINNTGNAFAQFLLGLANRAEQSVVLHPSYFRANTYRISLRDEYQFSRNLTWNFGIGLQINTPRREKYNRQSTIDLNLVNPTTGRRGALSFAGRNGRSNTFSPVQANWEPNLSFAWNPAGSRKTVVRGGCSLSYFNFPLYPTDFGTLGFNAAPFFVSANDQLSAITTLSGGFPANFIRPPDLRAEAANDLKADYFEPLGLLPNELNWRLEAERDLPWDFVVRLAYSGEKGNHLFTGDGVELNPLSPDALAFRDELNDLTFNLSLRPYPQFRGVSAGYAYPIGSSSSHRGTLRIEKRLSGGLNFSGSYLLSKTIDDVLRGRPPQNSTNLRVERAIAPWDATHQFSLNYLFELPFGEGRALLNRGGWAESIIGGWSVSGVTIFRSGTPVELKPMFNNTGGVAESLRVNVVPGVTPRLSERSGFQWFNAAAFDQPADFTLGNGPRTHPSLRNPGFQNFDMSLTKRIPVADEGTLELIVEAFNALNYGNLNQPDAVIGSQENPNLNAGRIVGTSGGRVVQLGLRFSF